MWDDPEQVDYFFMKTGKGVGPGVLCTHSGKYKFHKSTLNNKGNKQWYACAEKGKNRSGCLAHASMKKVVSFDETKGEEVVTWKLATVSSEKHHSLYHAPNQAEIMANAVMAKMRATVLQNPFADIRNIRDTVIDEEINNKLDPYFAKEVMGRLPLRIENTLHKIRRQGINKSIRELQ